MNRQPDLTSFVTTKLINNWAGSIAIIWMMGSFLMIHYFIVPGHIVIGSFWLWIFGILVIQLVPGLVFAISGLRCGTRPGRVSAFLAIFLCLRFVWYGLVPVVSMIWQLKHWHRVITAAVGSRNIEDCYAAGHACIMRFELILLALVLLLTSCGRHEATLSRQLVGTWTRDDFSTMTIGPNGSYSFTVRRPDQTNVFAGTWRIKGDVFIMTITNAPVIRGHSFVGSTERYSILMAHDHQLICAESGQSFTLNR